jgi:hypothetical protein
MNTETKVECEKCGETFDDNYQLGAHNRWEHDNPWEDEEKLREQYLKNGHTTYEISEMWGCDPGTVQNWLDKFGVERRQTGEWQNQGYVSYFQAEDGYMRWMDYAKPSRGDSIPVHRLLAVAEYGIEAVKDNHVHHINGCKWDNRPDNIELVDASEHIKLHQEKGEVPVGPDAQEKGNYDPSGLFVDVPNDERYEGMHEELKNEAQAEMEASD